MPYEHDHPVPRVLVLAGAAFVAALLVGILLLAAYAYSITARLQQVERVIDSRTASRDEQAAQMQEEFRVAVCDVLDSLPADDALTDIRVRYQCGPGITSEETP